MKVAELHEFLQSDDKMSDKEHVGRHFRKAFISKDDVAHDVAPWIFCFAPTKDEVEKLGGYLTLSPIIMEVETHPK